MVWCVMIIVFWLKPMDMARIRWRQIVEGALGGGGGGGGVGSEAGGVIVLLRCDE